MSRINFNVSALSSIGWSYQLARPRPSSSHCRRMLRCGCPGTIHCRLPSTEPGSFFYPVQLHLQATHFFVQFRLNRFVVLVAFGTSGGKDLSHAPLHLAFPLTDLRRMHLVLPGQLVNWLHPFQGLERNLGLKVCTVSNSFLPMVPPCSDHGSILLHSWSEFWGPL